ncbi:MAG: excinuclease ABC subunit UvrA, partial [Deltaproteobacteria bacterium]|nr:excinuclease ABC subunit UvrA [Deltaproteobacteria bacterium]
SLRIPHYQLIAVTGVSGSGKTGLVYDVLCAEGQRLFFENFTGGRLMHARLNRPKADIIEGLFPVIAIDQNHVVRSPRSTVGTLTELYDLLRLLFARLGKSEIPDVHPYRSLFSFNLPDGYCSVCKGLGVQDHIDPSLLIGDPSKTIRGGAFVLTTPNNYIVYSQVTMDVLDEVCRAEGFSVDIPWQDLSEEQKNVVLNGSDKIQVLFGKHPLESRLKWTGITAKPREKDYYKGILPVMEEILRRTALLLKLGTGHLSIDRESVSLSGGEAQRIRLANKAASGLRNVLYILDEPSVGLHPSEHKHLLEVMRSLGNTGNTVMIVDHDEQSIREADWIIDIGPGAGEIGGKILFNGPAETFFNQPQPESITRKYLVEQQHPLPTISR